jgi:hypothetical protein
MIRAGVHAVQQQNGAAARKPLVCIQRAAIRVELSSIRLKKAWPV